MMHLLRTSLIAQTQMLASASLMFFALPWLMVLLVLGTVAQRYIGLYASQKLFFGSFVLWVGWVPLPGAYMTLALITASLIAKLAFKSVFTLRRSGTLLIHVSAIVLLLGGLLSTLFREDGYMVLGDGETGVTIKDYRQMALVVKKNDSNVAAWPVEKLASGETHVQTGLPFDVKLLHYCYPCSVVPRVSAENKAELRGAATHVALVNAPLSPDESRNLHGALFEVSATGNGQDGTYLAHDRLAEPAQITVAGARYTIALAAAERALPFSVRLLHFTKSDYPGTDEAKAYRSDVAVKDDALEWNAAIEMNQPLRYKGYTFYQSSYVEEDGRLLSVLAVVKNAGEWFPYIAVIMLCTGLALHVALMLQAGRSRLK